MLDFATGSAAPSLKDGHGDLHGTSGPCTHRPIVDLESVRGTSAKSFTMLYYSTLKPMTPEPMQTVLRNIRAPHSRAVVSVCASFAALVVAMSALALSPSTTPTPLGQFEPVGVGPFWSLSIWNWFAVGLLVSLCLIVESQAGRVAAIASFGIATIASLGYLEPLGVFHDSWQNVGLGQLATSTAAREVDAARQIPYVHSSPGSFLLLGILRSTLPNTPSLLRIYPIFALVLYCSGVYLLAGAFAAAHSPRFRVDHTRYRLLSVFAFLALAPLFWVRINPAPQSLAFALMPFCLASMLKGSAGIGHRILALAAFCTIVLTHSITSVMIIAIGTGWMLFDLLRTHSRNGKSVLAPNTVLLYGSVFLLWMIYIGVWILRSGGSFVQRMLETLNSGQQAHITAVSTSGLEAFIWMHRGALAGGAVLILVGFIMIMRVDRIAGARLAIWFSTAAVWFPLLLFGEFADRGPLFAALPASLTMGYVFAAAPRRPFAWAMRVMMILTALTSYTTAYSNHTSEVISAAEVAAFDVIVRQSSDQPIAYGYAAPLEQQNLYIYGDPDRVREYAIGAADFSYERLIQLNGVVVISDQMRERATLAGPEALARLQEFEARMLAQPDYELIFDNGSVRAFRARSD